MCELFYRFLNVLYKMPFFVTFYRTMHFLKKIVITTSDYDLSHRRNPRDFYPLHFFHERSVADRNPVGFMKEV